MYVGGFRVLAVALAPSCRAALENIGLVIIGDDGIRIPKAAIDAAVKKAGNNPS